MEGLFAGSPFSENDAEEMKMRAGETEYHFGIALKKTDRMAMLRIFIKNGSGPSIAPDNSSQRT